MNVQFNTSEQPYSPEHPMLAGGIVVHVKEVSL